jgi:hypothetical protein
MSGLTSISRLRRGVFNNKDAFRGKRFEIWGHLGVGIFRSFLGLDKMLEFKPLDS